MISKTFIEFKGRFLPYVIVVIGGVGDYVSTSLLGMATVIVKTVYVEGLGLETLGHAPGTLIKETNPLYIPFLSIPIFFFFLLLIEYGFPEHTKYKRFFMILISLLSPAGIINNLFVYVNMLTMGFRFSL